MLHSSWCCWQVAGDCGKEDERGFARLPRDWIGVFHYKGGMGHAENNSMPDCPHVLDRVKYQPPCVA